MAVRKKKINYAKMAVEDPEQTIQVLRADGFTVTDHGTMLLDPDGDIPDDDDEILTPDSFIDAFGNTDDEPDRVARATDSNGPVVCDLTVGGIPLGIEYVAGSRRRLRNADGKIVYDRKLRHDYGFIKGSVGRDGDAIDVIVGPNHDSEDVFVIDMRDLGPDVDAREDEDKVCLGFEDEAAALDAFCHMYGKDWVRSVMDMSIDEFKDWATVQ